MERSLRLGGEGPPSDDRLPDHGLPPDLDLRHLVEITEGQYKVSPTYGGAEYETIGTFGSYCGIRLASFTSTRISAAIMPASHATSIECWRQFWP